jgi:hypothetical protein
MDGSCLTAPERPFESNFQRLEKSVTGSHGVLDPVAHRRCDSALGPTDQAS